MIKWKIHQEIFMQFFSIIVDAVDQLNRTNFGKPNSWSIDSFKNRFVWGSMIWQRYSIDLASEFFSTSRITRSVWKNFFRVIEFSQFPCLNNLITNDFRTDTRCRDNRIEWISLFRNGHFDLRKTSSNFRGIFLRITDSIDKDLKKTKTIRRNSFDQGQTCWTLTPCWRTNWINSIAASIRTTRGESSIDKDKEKPINRIYREIYRWDCIFLYTKEHRIEWGREYLSYRRNIEVEIICGERTLRINPRWSACWSYSAKIDVRRSSVNCFESIAIRKKTLELGKLIDLTCTTKIR